MSRVPTGAAPLRVMVVEDDALVGMGLKDQLHRLGHLVVGHAASAEQATALFREQRPDLVLMDIRLNDTDGIVLAQQFLQERRVPIVIISAFGDSELIDRASSIGVFGYLVKPVSIENVKAQIEVAFSRFQAQEQLIQEKEKLTQSLETRKLGEKAKGILMGRLNLGEPAAHQRLQSESQKRRISMAEIAKRVIESEELLGQ
jgi:response regulator NasT